MGLTEQREREIREKFEGPGRYVGEWGYAAIYDLLEEIEELRARIAEMSEPGVSRRRYDEVASKVGGLEAEVERLRPVVEVARKFWSNGYATTEDGLLALDEALCALEAQRSVVGGEEGEL